ncbi:MAG: hypothetical protein ACK559_18895, partial [bacterium]
LVHAAMQELQALGHLVIDLENRGDAQQHEESEVDHRVHETRSRVAQQGAHVDTRAVVGEATLHVLRGGAATIGRAAFPVAHAVGEAQ